MKNPGHDFVDPAPRGALAKIAIALYALSSVLVLTIGYSFIRLAERAPGDAAAAGRQVEMILLFSFPIYLFLIWAVVAYLAALMIWIFRVSSNAHALRGHDPAAIRPGWAVAVFWIPLVNLWLPYVVIRQAWRSTIDSAAPVDGPAPTLLKLWWAVWLFNVIYTIYSNRSLGWTDPATAPRAVGVQTLVGGGSSLVGIWLTALVVTRLTRLQHDAGERRLAKEERDLRTAARARIPSEA